MTRVKICGIRTLTDALVAADAGADAIGFVFYAPSPRNIDVATARAIAKALPPFVSSVGLFVNESPTRVREVHEQVGLDLVQLSGDETPAYAEALGLPHVKALRVVDPTRLVESSRAFGLSRGVLLDAHVPGAYGGTGVKLDWQAIAAAKLNAPIVLAGGLTPSNVAEAIRVVMPWAVDVSSGVESSAGVKDRDLIRAFVRAAKSPQNP